ncbi:unknown [Firmicutes bacterium CAG:240]|nr:unknown [Firmicutes bacterium CAG:240]
MKKTTLFALAVIVCLAGAVASSYCMAVMTASEASFGVLAVAFVIGFTLFVNKLTNALD